MAERRKQRLGLRDKFLQAIFRPCLAAAGNERGLAALGVLAGQGLVENRTNQGFFLSRDGAELEAAERSLPAAQEEAVLQAIGK